jgi:uncharacterized cupin superfamily protein
VEHEVGAAHNHPYSRPVASLRRRFAALVGVLVLIASACGSVDGASEDTEAEIPAESATSITDEVSPSLANAVRIDAAVNARIADATDYSGVSDPVPVAAGDNITTDTTGFAEIAYFDGSVTRLDTNTDFEVIELVDNPGNSIIRTRMGIGRTWNRVQALTGNDTYQIETAVATAVVRGTAFTIECDTTSCTFTVLEGTLELTLPNGTTITINAGQTITITADTPPGEPVAITTDPFTDEWLNRNNDLDTNTGNNDLTEEFADAAPTFDAEGETVVWELELTLTSWENGGDPFGPEIGHVTGEDDNAPRPPQLSITCFGNRCTADSSVGGAGWRRPLVLEPTPDGGLKGEIEEDQYCSSVTNVVGTMTITVNLTVDFARETVAGDLVRTNSILEAEGCRFSSETRSITGSLTQRGTCFELNSPETCLFLQGEDRPSHFDRPAEWS